jgi:hypothetical protein
MVIERIDGSSQVEFIFSGGKKLLLFGLLACMTAAASGFGAPQFARECSYRENDRHRRQDRPNS